MAQYKNIALGFTVHPVTEKSAEHGVPLRAGGVSGRFRHFDERVKWNQVHTNSFLCIESPVTPLSLSKLLTLKSWHC